MKATFLFILVALINLSCDTNFGQSYPYDPPQLTNDGFDVGTLGEVEIDTQLILKASERIHNGRHKEVHSMLIYKDQVLVFEEYYEGHVFQWDAPNYHSELIQWERDMVHDMMSCSKSITSACIGIAIELGYINNAQQSIFDYLPDHQSLKADNKEYITIEHLLTMSSGLIWDEWGAVHGTSANDIDMLWLDCEDPVSCVLERGWWAVPGDFFTYNGGGTIILGEILKNASGMNMDEFSKKYLFEPLGIESAEWRQFPNGVFDTAGSLFLSPRDMMKIGVTYLNDGLWNGEPVISSSWVEKSSQAYGNNIGINIPGEDSGICGYTYSWWTSSFSESGVNIEMYRAGGWGGQEIMVFPDLDMVVVFTGGNYATKTTLFKLIEDYILPAIF